MVKFAPTYTYIITRTTNVNVSNNGNMMGELRGVYGVYMDKYLSKPGNMTFSLSMVSSLMSFNDVIDMTKPGERSIWVYRDGYLMWSGIIWSRTYQTEGRVLSMTAQTYDAYLDRVIFPLNWTDTQFPHNIILDIWAQIPLIVGTYMASDYPRDFAISGYQSGFGAGNTLTVDGYQAPTLASLVDTCCKWGAEYRIQASTVGSLTGRWNYLQVGMWPPQTTYPGTYFTVGATPLNKSVIFQYPGSISKFWWPESLGTSAGGASSIYLVGKGSTKANTPFALVNNNSTVGNEMVGTSRRLMDDSIADQTQLNVAAANIAPLFKQPIQNPTFELNISHDDVVLPGIDVGDYFDYILVDQYRFPTGRKGQARCNGWTLKPPSTDGVEQFGITMVDQLSTVSQVGT